jgi:ATP-binding cassette subfamily F protein 3
VRPGDRIGLVGPNGAGKTSLFRIIAGQEKPDSGAVATDPGTVIGYFSQDVGEMSGRSVLEEVMSGAGRVAELAHKLEGFEHRMADPSLGELSPTELDEYGELQTEFLSLDGYSLEPRAAEILGGLGFTDARMREPVERFSGGWKMRVALAKILLLNPDVLLMDEPTNHLDLESIVWLESWLKEFKGDLVMTSHDREFMTRVCSRTAELANGALTLYSGDYDFYMREREIRRDQLIAAQKRQQAMLAKEEEFIAKFAARASHAAQVQSRVKTIEKIERIVIPPDPKIIKVKIEEAERSGDVVVEFKDLCKSFQSKGEDELKVLSSVNATVRRLEKIALTGVNGAGKSTLLKIVAGFSDPTSGTCALGAGVRLGYFSQYSSDVLIATRSIYDEVRERLPLASDGAIKNLLGAFQFSGDDVYKKVGVLSGGEKSRVMIACILSTPVNFLVLDEPTNHLDIVSREVLLEALQDFGGTLMIVSHDRYFLRHVANRVFHLEGGALTTFEGDFHYYAEKIGLKE